ncbi:PEPxxWA-CTERM sorting domain-containing protein [Phenylobacterium sp.]|uniref:PEPxxWA-CTERM sorting domain-containing protein n=1 Tax=Phenylobacterium sp. TaxID=1871053 RepID=UPI0025E40D2D|nr:PEPxxWA-CTERM sorting domain-containing protein [Phenylobacterium sp.]
MRTPLKSAAALGALAVLAAAHPASAATNTYVLDTGRLPSAQGWGYVGVVPETRVYSVVGGELRQDSIGIGTTGFNASYYTLPVTIGPTDTFAIKVVASLTGREAGSVPDYPFGVSFGISTPTFYRYVGLAGPRFGATIGGVSVYEYPPGFDPAAYNTYELYGSGARTSLDVNGVTVLSGATFDIVGPESFLLLGDGTNLANASANIRAFSFSSFAVPEPATWALMLTGFGLAGAAVRRRRAGAGWAAR